jgi:uncharacterized membrane protein YfcA
VPWSDALFAVFCVLLGYLVLGISGFGSALVIVPLLAWRWPLTLVVPLALLIDIPANLLHTGLNIRQVAWREIPRLLLPMVIGTVLGIFLIDYVKSEWLLLLLGIYIAVIGLRGFRSTNSVTPLLHARWAWPAGLAMGGVETMFGTAGPVVVAWLSRRLTDPKVLRATLPIAIAVVAAMAICMAAATGRINQALLWTALLVLLPVALAGVVVGHALSKRLPAQQLRRVVFGLLVLSGIAMVGRSIVSTLG